MNILRTKKLKEFAFLRAFFVFYLLLILPQITHAKSLEASVLQAQSYATAKVAIDDYIRDIAAGVTSTEIYTVQSLPRGISGIQLKKGPDSQDKYLSFEVKESDSGQIAKIETGLNKGAYYQYRKLYQDTEKYFNGLHEKGEYFDGKETTKSETSFYVLSGKLATYPTELGVPNPVEYLKRIVSDDIVNINYSYINCVSIGEESLTIDDRNLRSVKRKCGYVYTDSLESPTYLGINVITDWKSVDLGLLLRREFKDRKMDGLFLWEVVSLDAAKAEKIRSQAKTHWAAKEEESKKQKAHLNE